MNKSKTSGIQTANFFNLYRLVQIKQYHPGWTKTEQFDN